MSVCLGPAVPDAMGAGEEGEGGRREAGHNWTTEPGDPRLVPVNSEGHPLST